MTTLMTNGAAAPQLETGGPSVWVMGSPGFHPPTEEYLETIYHLREEGVPAIQARVAERLGHSAPSVSEMVHRLESEGFLVTQQRQLVLTDTGLALAEGVVRKHRLAECLLVDIIGLPWHQIHDEAARWEHVISDSVEARLIEVLGHPVVCPHGNPIPGSDGVFPEMVPLADVTPGTRIRVERIGESVQEDDAIMEILFRASLRPGALVTITDKSNRVIALGVDDGEIQLPVEVCRSILVSVRQ